MSDWIDFVIFQSNRRPPMGPPKEVGLWSQVWEMSGSRAARQSQDVAMKDMRHHVNPVEGCE